MFIKWILNQKKHARLSALLIIPVLALLIIFTLDLFSTCLIKQSKSNKKIEEISTYLQSEGLEYGYATFWNANIIPLLTDSNIKVRSVDIIDNNIHATMYQSNVNWYNNNAYPEYFLLLSTDEYSLYIKSEKYKQPLEIKRYMDYIILIYDYNIMNSK